jgi:hypothetical protein
MKLPSHMRRGARITLLVSVAVLAATCVTLLPRPQVPLVSAAPPGEGLATCAPSVQLLGFSDALNKTSFGGFNVAELSGLTYDPQRMVYYSIADRAGSAETHVFTLDLPVGSESFGVPTILDVTRLRDAAGSAFTGATFDGEGIAITHQRELLVASEGRSSMGVMPYEPAIRHFSLAGEFLEALTVPPRFLLPPAGQGSSNLSFESLALSPSGRSLFTANEQPLSADGQTADHRNRIRILRYEDRGPDGFIPAEQFFYVTDPDREPGDVGVSDMIALSEADLLVLERGFKAGEGNTVKVFRVSLEGATDVSNEPTLAAPGLVPLAKAPLFDLENCPPRGATLPPGATQPNPLLDNFEGMTLGPYLPGGRRALLLISDDNTGTNQTTRLIALAVPISSLVGQD